jgi:hypothetical protein
MVVVEEETLVMLCLRTDWHPSRSLTQQTSKWFIVAAAYGLPDSLRDLRSKIVTRSFSNKQA